MKIMQLLYYPGQGGAEQYAYLLAKGAISENNEVIFVFSEEGPLVKRVQKLGCRVIFVKMRSPFDPLAIKKLVKIFKEEKPDVVQTHFLRENFLAISATKFAPVGVIFSTVHRIEPKTEIQARFNKLYSSGLTKFIAASDLSKDYLVSEGVNRHKIVIIPNGAEIIKFNKEKIKKELNIRNEVVFSYVGRFTAEKGHRILLKAFKSLNLKNAKLILVGDGELKNSIEKYVKRLGLENTVIFTGGRDRGYEIIGISDFYIQPSVIENMPISVVEAMLQKIPIIASGNEAHRLLLKEGSLGRLFKNKSDRDLTKEIKEALKDRKDSEKRAANAYKYAKERFTAEVMWTKTKTLYEHALKLSAFKK